MSNVDMDKIGVYEYARDLHFKTLSLHTYGADGDLIGNPFIAISNFDKLEYILNPEFREFKLSSSKEVEDKLNEFVEASKFYLTKKEKFSKSDLYSIYKSLTKMQETSINYHYYKQAEELTKMLYKEFEVVPKDEVSKIVKGYATRQIMRGIDCSKDVERIVNDIENKEYGLMEQLKSRYEMESVKRLYYDNAIVYITQKNKRWYGNQYVAKTYGMKDYKEAVKRQKHLMEIVATM